MRENQPDRIYLPFSMRNGFEELPPQLKVGEVSEEFRVLLDYAFDSEITRESRSNYSDYFFSEAWDHLTKDLHVRHFRSPISSYSKSISQWSAQVRSIVFKAPLPRLFNFIEFVYRHPNCSDLLRVDILRAFLDSRIAYRIFDDGEICAIGSEQQAAAFIGALDESQRTGALGARQHLLQAGVALKSGEWAASIRESIHAVESAAVTVAPEAQTLGAALGKIEKQSKIHGALKAAFSQLYGYTSDEEGVRHALVFEEKSRVDETDALFMLGACASFVTYLLSRADLNS